MKPYLRTPKEPYSLSDYPEATAGDSGYLVTTNASWRSVRPVVTARRCTGCLLCYLHCPDGVISPAEKAVEIDYDFCKGCGICRKICSAGAIRMEVEEK